MTKEIHDINTRALDFVAELIDYIAEYPDDDYMTMECLCRKLHKHELIAKVDGHWQPLDKRCEDCIFVEGSHWCDGCDKTPKGMKEYDEYWATADRKTENSSEKPNNCEPQTKCYLRVSCDHYGDKQVCGRCREYSLYSHTKDEPQKHCHRPSDVACHPEQGDMWCRGCDYWYANEPQTERSE